MSDDMLMGRVASGDATSFRTLVLRHQGAVINLAYRYFGNGTDAEDAAQEAFLRLYEAAVRYRPGEASFRTYLLTITSRLCLNRKARRSWHNERPPAAAGPGAQAGEAACPAGPEASSPEALLLRRELERAVREAVQALPDDQRMAILLFRFEGLNYDEIGAVLGKSPSAVTSLLWRARERLRRELKWLVDIESGDLPAPVDCLPNPHESGAS